MSRSYNAEYRLERERKEALRRKKVAEVTETLYRRYQAQLEHFVSMGYRAYIPDKLSNLEADLSQVRNYLEADMPDNAQKTAKFIGRYIGSLELEASIELEKYERSERMRVEREANKKAKISESILEEYYALVSKIDDPFLINVSQEKLQEVKLSVEADPLSYDTTKLSQIIEQVLRDCKPLADNLRTTHENKCAAARLESMVEDVSTLVESQVSFDSSQSELMKNRIQALKASITLENSSYSSIEGNLDELNNKIEEVSISEEVRRTAVRSIYEALDGQEFTVYAPELFQDGDRDYVRLVAERPSGKRVVCNVDNHGSVTYTFDQYEGMTCLKDIEQFNVDLDNIYSVKLSNERVLWSNPDKLSKDSYNAFNDETRSV